MNTEILFELTYLLSAILFVVGLKRLQSPATARTGNAIAAFAMFIAIVATVLDNEILSWMPILVGIAIGGVVGAIGARMVAMTSMPEMVGLFNGMGGGASALVRACVRSRPGRAPRVESRPIACPADGGL